MRQKLKNLIDSGADIEFTVQGRSFVILPWTEQGIMIGEKNVDDDTFFDDADSLIDGYMIDGKHLSELLSVITIEFTS